MIRKFILSLLCLGAFTCLAASAQEFSGEIVNTANGQETHPAKIYVGDNKMRVEESENQGRSGVVIMNFSNETMDVLIPQQHMYVESKPGQGPMSHRMFRFFRPDDVNNACNEWKTRADHPEGTCERVGSDTVNGRSAVKYKGTSSNGDTNYFWLDTKLKFPLKWQGPQESGELRNIQEGPQPASLFEIPAGYQKMDMGNMMGHAPQH